MKRPVAYVSFLLVLGWALPAAAQLDPAFGGTYRYAGGDGQRSAFARAVETVVEQMNVVIRGIARQRITARVKIQPRMAFRRQGDDLLIVHEPLPPRATKLDGTALPMTNDAGDRIVVTYTHSGRAIIETIRSGRSSQRNTYRFSPEGDRLTFTAEIQSPMLPAVIHYSLTYRRVLEPGAVAVLE